MTITLVTLGCAKNQVDSARMAQLLRQAGFVCRLVEPDTDYADTIEDEKPDAVIINTCGFLESAVLESLSVIFDWTEQDEESTGDAERKTKVIVAGCVPARYGNDFSEQLPEVDAFVPCAEEENIVAVVKRVLAGNKEGKNETEDAQLSPCACSSTPLSVCDKAPLLYEDSSTFAYIKISDGCNRFCSYCTIPYIRGRYKSFPLDQILADCDDACAAGVKEFIFIAQDTGIWGYDLQPSSDLPTLLDVVAQRYPAMRLRVLYIQPEGLSEKLLQTVKAHANICRYFDIPLQHCDEAILHAMNRKGSYEDYMRLVRHVREVLPDAALRTTLIAGFPGESEEAFQNLCDFITEAEFDYVGVFPFSPEEGTKASTLPGQIDEEERKQRAQILRDIADSVSERVLARRLGTETEVLIEGEECDGQLFGRTFFQAPDCDGQTYVNEGHVGDLVKCTLVDSILYEFEGETLS